MDRGRRLFWHGILLFVLFLAQGLFVPAFANPRMAVSAHAGGLMSGIFLAVVGLGWGQLRLAGRHESLAFACLLFGIYGSSWSLVLAAAFGTGSMTPIVGEGYAAAFWQEALVSIGLVTSAVALFAGCFFLLRGLGGRATAP